MAQPHPAAADVLPFLVGDCDASGDVSIAELVLGVAIVLGFAPLDGCRALDRDADGAASVAEIVLAIGAALSSSVSPFGEPRRVTILGYDGDAMEPFLTRDGRYLFFNDSNAPSADTNLYYAERLDDLTFQYRGEIRGVNSAALDAVASMDRDGVFYFISTRSYGATLSTIYRGVFADGAVEAVELLSGLSEQVRGHVNFDAEISVDGMTLYFVDGIVDGGAVPAAADLAIAVRQGNRFERSPRSSELLANVNSEVLEYAPSTSADGLELLFTRLAGGHPAIYRTIRQSLDSPFGRPQRVSDGEPYVEAPSLSADGLSFYYHRKVGDRFVVYRRGARTGPGTERFLR